MGKTGRFTRKGRSKPEKEIFNLLKKMFPTLIIFQNYNYGRIIEGAPNRLLADIYLQSFGIVIEFNGAHHYKPVFYGKSEEDIYKAKRAFEETKKRDKIKREWCKKGKIRLITIPYKKWEKLSTIQDKIDYLYEVLG